ncbi:MAG: TlpA family protein disulfide reductase [Sedimentisphaerales bacterium]|nr:TlpA family protein disulfide reductase [Sedimentisphaerales bacterium]
MSKTVRKICIRLLSSLLVLLGAVILPAGCKETASEPNRVETAESQSVQAPAEVAKPQALNTEKPRIEAPVTKVPEPKKNMMDVIRNARSWELSRKFIPLIGKEAPDFTLTDINGKVHKLSDYRGKNVMLEFWATWCPPCKISVPHLIELQETHGNDKLAILALSYVSSYPPNTAEMIKQFAADNKLNYTVFAVENGEAGGPYESVNELPTTFFIDPKGIIKLPASGFMPLDDSKAALEAEWPEGAF